MFRTIVLFVLGLTAGNTGETGRTGLTAGKTSVNILCSVSEHLSAKTSMLFYPEDSHIIVDINGESRCTL